MFNLKRMFFWLIGLSPTLLMLVLLMYVAIKEAFLSQVPCISRGCAFEEGNLMMDLLIALLMSWGAHAIQGVVISVIGNNNNGRNVDIQYCWHGLCEYQKYIKFVGFVLPVYDVVIDAGGILFGVLWQRDSRSLISLAAIILFSHSFFFVQAYH